MSSSNVVLGKYTVARMLWVNEKSRTSAWEIENVDGATMIGIVKMMPGMKRYVLFTYPGAVLDRARSDEVMDFIDSLNAARSSARKGLFPACSRLKEANDS